MDIDCPGDVYPVNPVWYDIITHLTIIGRPDASLALSRTSAELYAGFRAKYRIGLFPERIIGHKMSTSNGTIIMRPFYAHRCISGSWATDIYIVSKFVYTSSGRSNQFSVRIIKFVSAEDVDTSVEQFKITPASYAEPRSAPAINCGKIDAIVDLINHGGTYHVCIIPRQSIIGDYLKNNRFIAGIGRLDDTKIVLHNDYERWSIDDIVRVMTRQLQHVKSIHGGTYTVSSDLHHVISEIFTQLSLNQYPSAETHGFIERVASVVSGR